MARHANTPRRFMHMAMKFAVRLLDRLFRRMTDGSTDVHLWRYESAKVPLNLYRFHPWGWAVHVQDLSQRQRRASFLAMMTLLQRPYWVNSQVSRLSIVRVRTIMMMSFPAGQWSTRAGRPSRRATARKKTTRTQWLGPTQS